MTKDRQLRDVKLADVLEKRWLGQALNIKEFAVLAGVSYSVAREWFQMKGFPRFEGVVFWQDFVEWRNNRNGGNASLNNSHHSAVSGSAPEVKPASASRLPHRAARILLESSK